MVNLEKARLRTEIKEYRRSISVSDKNILDGKVFDNLLKSGLIENRKLVLAYISTEIEVGTRSIIDFCLENGIGVAVPRCSGKRKMDFFMYSHSAIMEKSPFGILEPVPEKCIPVTDFYGALCIVPGLAFDRYGYRLGYGGGFYDSFLEKEQGLVTVGICYHENIFDKLPTGDFDKKVNFIVTDKFTEEING